MAPTFLQAKSLTKKSFEQNSKKKTKQKTSEGWIVTNLFANKKLDQKKDLNKVQRKKQNKNIASDKFKPQTD